MRERRRLAGLSSLAVVQRAKRLAAESAMSAAALAEDNARKDERAAARRCDEASRDWADHIGSPGFCPEYGLGLSSRMIGSDDERIAKARAAEAAAERHAERQADWQVTEAQVRITDGAIKRLKRKLGRKDEEKRLSEAAGRSRRAGRAA